jgi:hypothetical protein
MVRAPLLKWCGNILLLPSKCRRLKGGRADIFLCAIGRNRARQNPASEIEARRVDWVRFFVALRMTANCDDRGKVKRTTATGPAEAGRYRRKYFLADDSSLGRFLTWRRGGGRATALQRFLAERSGLRMTGRRLSRRRGGSGPEEFNSGLKNSTLASDARQAARSILYRLSRVNAAWCRIPGIDPGSGW